MFKRFGVRLIDFIFYVPWAGALIGVGIIALALLLIGGVAFFGMFTKAPPTQLEQFPVQAIYPSELAAMRDEQPILLLGLPTRSAPLWYVPSDHLFELPNRSQVNRQIAALDDVVGQVEWPCEPDNDALEAIVAGLREVDAEAGRNNSAVFYHRAVAASLSCSWGQAERDFAQLERLLDDAEERRPEAGWENSEPRFWAVRAAARYLQGDMELRRISNEELKDEPRREAAERAFAQFRAALDYLQAGDMAAIPRDEQSLPFPTTDSRAALLELDSANIVNQMAVAALISEVQLGEDDWQALFGRYVSERSAMSDRPILGLNLQMLALVHGYRQESLIFQPSESSLQSSGELARAIEELPARLADIAGRQRSPQPEDYTSRWQRIASWRTSLSAEDGNPADVITSYLGLPRGDPDREFYRAFLRDVSTPATDPPDSAQEEFRAALPRDVRGGGWAWALILFVGIGVALMVALAAEVVRRTAEPLYGRAHFTDRRKAERDGRNAKA